MAKSNYEECVEAVKALNPAEQWRLRDLLDILLAPPREPPTEEEFEQEMLREGVLDQVPPPIKDLTPYENRKPIDIPGKPLSETILEERR
jgi:hypothetical protein